MTERDEITQQDLQRARSGENQGTAADERQTSDIRSGSRGRAIDDRRRPVRPTDNPVPRSPQADEHAVREGEEKLARVKPY